MRQSEAEQDARFLPVGNNGRATAIKVYAIRTEGHLAEIGLRDGDAIIAINGRYISEHPSNAVHSLYAERRLILHIQRGGQRRMLYWQAPANEN